MIKLIKENNFPFNYVGDGKVVMEGFCPDFIYQQSKKIIEVFGDYWHNLNKEIKRHKKRLTTYKKGGYKTLIIWEHEIRSNRHGKSLPELEIVNRIKNFVME